MSQVNSKKLQRPLSLFVAFLCRFSSKLRLPVEFKGLLTIVSLILNSQCHMTF